MCSLAYQVFHSQKEVSLKLPAVEPKKKFMWVFFLYLHFVMTFICLNFQYVKLPSG